MKIRTTFVQLSTSARLAVCLAVSVALHLVVAWDGWLMSPPEAAAPSQGVRVTLVAAPSTDAVRPSASAQTARPVEAVRPESQRQVPVQNAPPIVPKSQVVQPAPLLKPEETTPEPVAAASPPLPAEKSPRETVSTVLPNVDLACAALKTETAGLPADAESVETSPAEIKLASLPGFSDMPAEGAPVGDPDLVDATPRYRSNPLPDYPYLARQRHWEGVVWLLVDVSHKGRVTALKVAESSGYGALDKSALKGVRRWRFDPARRLGIAVDSQVRVPVEFRLQN